MSFGLSWDKVKGALISAAITAILTGAGYIIGVGDIFNIDLRALANVVSLSALTALVSLIKAFFTTPQGEFAGAVKVQ